LLPQEHTDLIRGSVLQAQVLVPGLFSHRWEWQLKTQLLFTQYCSTSYL
jgi:hypothetical protein